MKQLVHFIVLLFILLVVLLGTKLQFIQRAAIAAPLSQTWSRYYTLVAPGILSRAPERSTPVNA